MYIDIKGLDRTLNITWYAHMYNIVDTYNNCCKKIGTITLSFAPTHSVLKQTPSDYSHETQSSCTTIITVKSNCKQDKALLDAWDSSDHIVANWNPVINCWVISVGFLHTGM